MFSQQDIYITIYNQDVQDKYAEYLKVFDSHKSNDLPRDLEEWVRAISDGECRDFSLKSSVLSVIDAAIFSIVTPYHEMMRIANLDAKGEIRNAGLEPSLERRLIKFNRLEADIDKDSLEGLEDLRSLESSKVEDSYIDKVSSPSSPAESSGLNLSQQFMIRSFETQVDEMSENQKTVFLKDIYRHMMCREAVFKTLIKKQWGLDTNEDKRSA